MTSDGTLGIRNMQKKDGGVYGCLASNQAGTDTMTSILTYIGECHRPHPSIHPIDVLASPVEGYGGLESIPAYSG